MRSWKYRLGTLCLATAGACLASGPVAAWPTLEPLLEDQGVFAGESQKSLLSSVYSIAQGVMMVAGWPTGIVYDRYGARTCAVGGGLIAAVGLVGMAVAIAWPSMNWLLFVAYPLATFGGSMNSYGLYAFQWAFPNRSNTINSLMLATGAVSDSIVLIAVGLHNCCGLQLQWFMFMIGIVSLFASLICWLTVPTRRQMFLMAAVVTHTLSEVEHGIPRPPPPWRQAVNLYKHIKKHAPVGNALLLLYTFCFYLFLFYPMAQQFFYYSCILGKEAATTLVDDWAIIYAVLGAISAVGCGRLADWTGVPLFALISVLSGGLFLLLLLIPAYPTQVMAQIILALAFNAYIVALLQSAMRYSPLDLFGTYTGIMMTVLGLGQMSLNPLLTHAAGETMHGYAKYATLYSILGVLVAVSGAALLVYWRRFPLPAPGTYMSSLECSEALSQDTDNSEIESDMGDFTYVYGAVAFKFNLDAEIAIP